MEKGSLARAVAGARDQGSTRMGLVDQDFAQCDFMVHVGSPRAMIVRRELKTTQTRGHHN